MDFLVGVDEVGRGPLAGPVAVGVVIVRHDFDWELLPGVNDSKQLSPEKREALFRLAWRLRCDGVMDWSVGMSSAAYIDRAGIVPAIERAQGKVMNQLAKRANIPVNRYRKLCNVKLDGGLRAPKEYLHQETIIKGDAKEPVIGLASIMAKVTRDRYMVRRSAQPIFAPYDFAQHKGYGTAAHCKAIRQHGLTPEHRLSFCRNLR